jgi:hypothetical protein
MKLIPHNKPYRILRPIKLARGTEASRLINEIKEISNGIRTYLEIGVEYGRTLEAVESKIKIAIDPKFRFNKFFKNKNTKIYEMTSDVYFHENQCPDIDVAFLDGFHSGEQTFKDFRNIVPGLSKKSIVIIDDVFPSDFHSSLETPEKAFGSRENSGLINDFKWHGDVFNAIFAIIQHFPHLIFFTVADLSNPVTVFFNFEDSYSNNIKSLEYFVGEDNASFLQEKDYKIPQEFNPDTKENILKALKRHFKN